MSWAVLKWVTHSGFRVIFRLDTTETDARATVEVASDSAFANVVASTADAFHSGISPGSYTVFSLQPATTYYYRITENTTGEELTGQVRTFPLGAATVKIAVGNCAQGQDGTNYSNSTIYTRIKEHDPDLFLHLGDLHYKDRCTPYDFEQVYSLSEPGTFFRSTPWGYVWDDHDYGGNNVSGEFYGGTITTPDGQLVTLSRGNAWATFNDYGAFRLYRSGGIVNEPSMHEIIIGRVRVVMLDTRSMRETGTMLGTVQMTELAEIFDDVVANQNQALMICSGVPWIGTSSDHWGGYSTERAAIADMIHTRGLTNRVFFVCGDMHGLAYDDGSNNRYGSWSTLTKGPPVFQCGSLDASGSLKGGPYSGGYSTGRYRFGEFDFVDSGTNTISVTWRGWMYSAGVGSEMLTHSFTLTLGQVVDPEIPDEDPPPVIEGSQNVDTLDRDSSPNVALLGRTPGPVAPTIVTTSIPNGAANAEEDYVTQIAARGDPATGWTVVSELPFSIDENGLLTLPRSSLVPGLYELTLTVTNDTGTDSATLDFLVPNEMAGAITPIVTSITLVPDTARVAVGATVDLQATVLSHLGATIEGVQVTPAATNGGLGVVALAATDADGVATVRATGVSVGETYATVRVDTITSNPALITVEEQSTEIEASGTESSTPSGSIGLLALADDVTAVDIAVTGGTVVTRFVGEIDLVSTAGETVITASGTEVSTPSGSTGLVCSVAPDLSEDEAVAIAERNELVRLPDDPAAYMVFDFRASIATGESIDSVTVTATNPGFEDLDALPSQILRGPPGIAGELVVQSIGGGVAGCRYVLRCVALTSTGQRLVRDLTVRVLEAWRRGRRIV